MPLYHVTQGEHDDYGTYCFIEAPEGQGAAIKEAITSFAKASNQAVRLTREQEHRLQAEFEGKFGKGPIFGEKFGDVYPQQVAVLAVGKKHVDFAAAKKAQEDFLATRESRKAERIANLQRQDAYIAENMPPAPEITLKNFFQPDWKLVKIEKIHIEEYIPYTGREDQL